MRPVNIRQGATVDQAEVRAAQREAVFQRGVCSLLNVRGWLWHHETDSRRSKPGLPDLIAVRGGRLLFIELKSEAGALTRAQRSWLRRLKAAQVEVYLWRPSDWAEIEKVLT